MSPLVLYLFLHWLIANSYKCLLEDSFYAILSPIHTKNKRKGGT